ncbi:hypothetical protein AXY1_1 [Achromobacter phage AXY1]|nr:hypothetical protein AXY1_1 [Achromobacter phage AXY1]
MQNLIDREKVSGMLYAVVAQIDAIRDSDDVAEFMSLPYDVAREVRNEFKGDLFGKCNDIYSLHKMRKAAHELAAIVDILDAERATVSDEMLMRLALATQGEFDVSYTIGAGQLVTKRIRLADMQNGEWRSTLADALRKIVGFNRYTGTRAHTDGPNHGNHSQG